MFGYTFKGVFLAAKEQILYKGTCWSGPARIVMMLKSEVFEKRLKIIANSLVSGNFLPKRSLPFSSPCIYIVS